MKSSGTCGGPFPEITFFGSDSTWDFYSLPIETRGVDFEINF